MIAGLKWSLILSALLKQFVLDAGRHHKVVSKELRQGGYFLRNFINKNNHLLRSNKELSDKLDKLLEDSKDILRITRKN